ncbi:triple gene block protein 2 [Cnidium virus X]|uniref:Triple gene block protein 2 n=1 Tax=Cnidium virus X TaxID=2510428 RepID=A0A455TQM8_9VIRU|nr:triple gene block protein 2 [Cnidium virus X]QVW10165.1 triple gene block protein 2 [Cnidium virus X]QVW10168.1 triple gene block protein 2 [Cnidium virus X]WMZ16729.1 MAG: triple gene block protein 2 [Cnidium virus X]BBI37362.1 triple gene block protein 2 [Cnidium virus X]
MPLTPDTQQQTFRTLIACVCVVAAFWALTRSTLPHVGDPSHSLPFGGWYKDGTKSFAFNGQQSGPNSNHKSLALVLALVIIIVLHALARRSNNNQCARFVN